MKAILNIGLASSLIGPIKSSHAEDVVRSVFGPIISNVIPSDTEPTLVAQVDPGDMGMNFRRIEMVAVALGQDCIAVWMPDLESGALIGPRAHKWGEFNPEFFLMPDGARLSETQAVEA